MVDRDERRWNRADKNGDDMLSKQEFTDFLHPEEADHMKDIVVEVTRATFTIIYFYYDGALNFSEISVCGTRYFLLQFRHINVTTF